MWVARSYPSAKPLGPYITDLVNRLNMFSVWIEQGQPLIAWLPGFFFTQSFLTAVLQNFARKYKLPVDSLKFRYNILSDPPSQKAEDGCCIHGLYLDGGRWNSTHQCLADPQPKVIYLHNLVLFSLADAVLFDHHLFPRPFSRRSCLSSYP